MISKMYLKQIHPELFLDNNPDDTGIADYTKGEDKQQKEDTQFMIDYILAEKCVHLQDPCSLVVA